MEKRFLVEIEYLNTNRRNHLVLWAVDIEEAMNLALKWWGYPTAYKNITIKHA